MNNAGAFFLENAGMIDPNLGGVGGGGNNDTSERKEEKWDESIVVKTLDPIK